MGIAGLIIAILIIWRLYRIFKIIFTLDFLVGLMIDLPLLLMISYYCNGGGGRSSSGTAIFFLILCIVFGFFKNKLIPRKWRAPFMLPVSTGWVVANSIVMAVFIVLYSTLEYHVSFNRMTDVVLPVCWLFGLFLMIVSNSARVPWLALTNICLLGLLVYNVSNDGGRGDANYDGADTYYDTSLPDDSIWANFSSDTPVIDATPDIGITDFMIPGTETAGFMAPGADFAMSAVPDFTPLDTWGSFNLTDTSFATDVPQFASNPYMALSTGASLNDNFQICDASGMPELTISDGTIFNSENVAVGHINYDSSLHMTTYTDAANIPYMHVDQANNIYTGDGCLMGHLSDSANVRTVFDAKGAIPYRIDKLTNTIFDAKTGNIIGKIKNC